MSSRVDSNDPQIVSNACNEWDRVSLSDRSWVNEQLYLLKDNAAHYKSSIMLGHNISRWADIGGGWRLINSNHSRFLFHIFHN